MKIRPLENIIKYFKDAKAERKAEAEREDKEFELHQKRATYIDSLQLNLGSILGDRKKIIYENDKARGYFVAIGYVRKEGKKESVYPDLTIILETMDPQKSMLRVWNAYRNDVIMEFPILNDNDYKTARDSICDYVSQRFKKN